jgi:hypothetical protein
LKKATYYVAIFGNPNPPERDTVESGKYYLGRRVTDLAAERGDILLLYCTGSYIEHCKSVPGVGIVLTKDNESIYYRYLPLSTPIFKDHIDRSFNDEDKLKFSNIRFDSFWMFNISPESFRNTISNVPINWP